MTAIDEVTLRRYRRDDLANMAELINARVAEDGEGEHATALSMAENYDHLQNCDPSTDIIVAEDATGRVVGYTRTMWADVSEGYRGYYVPFEALPELGELKAGLLAWGVARAETIAATHDHPDKRIITWASDGGSDEKALAGMTGFIPFSWSAYMVRQHLRDIPDRALPAGLEIRAVEPSHLRAVWESDIEAFRDHRGYVEQNETDWERFRHEATRGTELWQVAWDGDGVAGQVRTYVTEGEAEALRRRRAWTENISTRREWRGKGVASALIATSLRQLAELGFDEAALGVDLDNPTGALGIYQRMGYEVVLRQTQYFRQL